MKIMDIIFKAGILAALTAHVFFYAQDVGSRRYQSLGECCTVLDSKDGVMYMSEPLMHAGEPGYGKSVAWSALTGERIKPERGR